MLMGMSVVAQTPYTQPEFQIDSLIDVVYGTATNYSGYTDTLKMDIYKPKGDNNCKRPVILFLHGGAWVVNSKEDPNMQFKAREMAKRGWVVANINYRLGAHKAADYEQFMLCPGSLAEPCAYISDTAEAIRANYRAMQDAKGAVRFMKNRSVIDSTDINNVYMAGESAGGYTSFLVAYLDRESEKPVICNQIDDAVAPSSYFDDVPCAANPVNLERPDLGDIHGDLNLGNHDASIKGIGSFFGAVFDLNIFDENETLPSMYLFCQGSDVIVHYIYGKLFGRIDAECYNNFLCQNYENYPHCYGNEGLRQYFEENPEIAPNIHADIVDNFNEGGNCMESGHAVDSPMVRLQSMANFFAEQIAQSGNNPTTNCNSSAINYEDYTKQIVITNNCTENDFYVTMPVCDKKVEYTLLSSTGQVLKKGKIEKVKTAINLGSYATGIYFFTLSSKQFVKTYKVIRR